MEEKIVGLVINDSERKLVYEIAKNYELKGPDDLRFILEKNNYLFLIKEKTIGLIGIEVMRRTKIIIHGAIEFEKHLNQIETISFSL